MDEDDLEMNSPRDFHQEAYVSKYAKISQPRPFSKRPPKNKVKLEWDNINYKISSLLPPDNIFLRWLIKLPIPGMLTNFLKLKVEKQILNNISGYVNSGQLVAIMGPTGSGKTTLMNILAKRIKHGVTGQIKLNGKSIKEKKLKRRMAYVLQDDIFFPNLTVRETINYTAYLKLGDLTWEERKRRIDEIITELDLDKAVDIIVGGGWIRGVSGGERKRTNIANELVSNQALMFLDEPTSGLDSSTALGLIITLKNLAISGHTIISTIHQPSSSMFLMFDHIILLAEGGHMIYFGPTSEVLSYFDNLGFQAPSHYNPADFMLELATCQEKLPDGRIVKQMLIDAYVEKIEPDKIEIMDDVQSNPKFTTSFLTQLGIMTLRSFKQRKSAFINYTHFFTILSISVLAGLLWFQLDKSENYINDRLGFLFFSCMFWTMDPWFVALYSFLPERAVLNKERLSGTYRLSAYFIGKTLAETPLELLLPFLYSIVSYWMVGLSSYFPNFLMFVFLIWSFVLLGSSMGLMIAATVTNVEKALTITVVVIIGSVLLGGFYIEQNHLHNFISWIRWSSLIKYGYEALLINEFSLSDQVFIPTNNSSYATDPITGQEILNHCNVETNIWGDIIFLLGTTVVARILTYLSLRFLNKPNI